MGAVFDRLFHGDRHRELTIYLHFPCFDGVASAVLAGEALRVTGNLRLGRVIPVSYEMRREWLNLRLPKPSAIVDFLFHPDAAFWADHHSTTFVSESAKKQFESRSRTNRFLYDSSAASCASVLWNACGQYISTREPYFEIVQWANKIDSAAYDSVEEAILGDAPALRINRSLFINPDLFYCEFLVRTIASKGLAATARHDEVTKRDDAARKKVMRGLQIAKRETRLFGNVAVLRFDETPNAMVSRYAPYVRFPAARYSITCFRSSRFTKITAMRNPWLLFDSIPLGELLGAFGGGGHQRVGSVIVQDNDKAEVIVDSLINAINRQQVAVTQHESVFA